VSICTGGAKTAGAENNKKLEAAFTLLMRKGIKCQQRVI
jgi:hypothetical protein